jgi:carboxyl-terminal processing protease
MACHSITAKQRYSNLFAEAIDKIEQFSLQPVTDRQLFESAMKGMVEPLDENSAYLSGDDFLDMEQRLRQEFGGVGMFVDINPSTGKLTVTSPIPNSPAFKHGIRSGDVIEKINGVSTEGLERADAIRRMRGPSGEMLRLTVVSAADNAVRDLEIVRETISTQSVIGDVRNDDGTWNFQLPEDPRIAYINILDFSERTDQELAEIVERVSPQMQGMILDLRTNGGGLLTQAVRICDMFFGDREKIVEIRGRGGRLVQPPFLADAAVSIRPGLPVVVLVDRYSASASEIVAACLQDHHRAVVIGERTYGKGTVQDLIPLERGKSSIKITTASYWRPNGKNMDKASDQSKQDWGVQPDPGFEIPLTEDEFYQVTMLRNRRQYKTLDIFNRSVEDRPSEEPDESPSADEAPAAAKPLEEDPALQRAIKHLSGLLDQLSTT